MQPLILYNIYLQSLHTRINWARNSVGRVFALHAKSPAFESLPVHFIFFLFVFYPSAQCQIDNLA